jgi:hypothetical protein
MRLFLLFWTTCTAVLVWFHGPKMGGVRNNSVRFERGYNVVEAGFFLQIYGLQSTRRIGIVVFIAFTLNKLDHPTKLPNAKS